MLKFDSPKIKGITNLMIKTMLTQPKLPYCTPIADVVEAKTEGVICGSQGPFNSSSPSEDPGPFNAPFTGTGEDW